MRIAETHDNSSACWCHSMTLALWNTEVFAHVHQVGKGFGGHILSQCKTNISLSLSQVQYSRIIQDQNEKEHKVLQSSKLSKDAPSLLLDSLQSLCSRRFQPLLF